MKKKKILNSIAVLGLSYVLMSIVWAAPSNKIVSDPAIVTNTPAGGTCYHLSITNTLNKSDFLGAMSSAEASQSNSPCLGDSLPASIQVENGATGKESFSSSSSSINLSSQVCVTTKEGCPPGYIDPGWVRNIGDVCLAPSDSSIRPAHVPVIPVCGKLGKIYSKSLSVSPSLQEINSPSFDHFIFHPDTSTVSGNTVKVASITPNGITCESTKQICHSGCAGPESLGRIPGIWCVCSSRGREKPTSESLPIHCH